ncbi:MAG: DUF1329 domain-containing protein [Panacagrimonas sp.]
MKRWSFLLLWVACASALAKVTPHEAETLRNRLTPMGAERARNEAGTIPEWRGGQTAPPPCYRPGARYCDPYADDAPIATITAVNADQWRDQLSSGQLDMLLRYPKTYRMKVYPSRRSFANPGAIYEATFRNAQSASLRGAGEILAGAARGIPFPIPGSGPEPMWNHRLRYQGPGFTRRFGQAAVTPSGDLVLAKVREDAHYPYALADSIEDFVPMRWLQVVLEPERLHGLGTLIHETLDPEEQPRSAWRDVPESRLVGKERSFGYDGAAMLGEELRFDDQIDTWLGGLDRYNWRIADKREMLVPYNSYALHSGRASLRELARPVHIDPDYPRYELHRVWVVEANVRPGAVHRYKRRTFYLDEDSWQILLVDLYDNADRLWRWQEVHTVMAYDRAVLLPVFETIHDLISGRYWFQGLDRDDPEVLEQTLDEDHFTPSSLRALTP